MCLETHHLISIDYDRCEIFCSESIDKLICQGKYICILSNNYLIGIRSSSIEIERYFKKTTIPDAFGTSKCRNTNPHTCNWVFSWISPWVSNNHTTSITPSCSSNITLFSSAWLQYSISTIPRNTRTTSIWISTCRSGC